MNEQTQPTPDPRELVKDLEPRGEEAEVKGGSNEHAIEEREGFGSFEPK